MVTVTPARSSADLGAVLVRDYVAWLGIDLSFQT